MKNRMLIVFPLLSAMLSLLSFASYATDDGNENKDAGLGQELLRKPFEHQPNFLPLSLQKDYPLFLIYFSLVAVIIIALLMLVKIKEVERRTLPH